MESDEALREDLPQPGWKERIGAVRRAAAALFATRAEIFREELSEKGSLFAKAAIGLALAAAFGGLAILLLTALLAAVMSRLLGGPIAGIAATLVLYVIVAAVGAILGSFFGAHVANLLGRRVTYFLISLGSTVLTCGIYGFWWMADAMRGGNYHFQWNWPWEDALLAAVPSLSSSSP